MFFLFEGEGALSPTGYEIDGKHLDPNEREVKECMQKFKLRCPTYGITVMCDSWTGMTGMSLINFMIYCNGSIFFHKSVDAMKKS